MLGSLLLQSAIWPWTQIMSIQMLVQFDFAKLFWYVMVPFDQGTFDGLSWYGRLHNIHSHSAHCVFLLERPAFDAAGVATWMATRTLWWEQNMPFRLSAKCSTSKLNLGRTGFWGREFVQVTSMWLAAVSEFGIETRSERIYLTLTMVWVTKLVWKCF